MSMTMHGILEYEIEMLKKQDVTIVRIAII